jgi:hypothetical protein
MRKRRHYSYASVLILSREIGNPVGAGPGKLSEEVYDIKYCRRCVSFVMPAFGRQPCLRGKKNHEHKEYT